MSAESQLPEVVFGLLRRRRVRSAVKVLVDAICATLAVLTAIAIGGGPSSSGLMTSATGLTV
jgi:hypothetical protein